jgi:anti-anti-sigma factor
MSLRDDFSLDVYRDGARVTLVLRGDLDIASARQIREPVLHNTLDGRAIVVDITELGFIDSIEIRALIDVEREVRAAGSTLTFTRPSNDVAATLELCGVMGMLPVEHDLT